MPTPTWQPIASAAKDGTRILVWIDQWFSPFIAQWGEDDEIGDAWIDDDGFATDPQPTHWMPLPAPPEGQ